ncbi:AAA family ATPase [Nonomuraea sp. NPDC049141]|uniref:ATP-binding protein n=1 Tax=Nonomuraea sp. NPDC049141 TaxID=3155500 RepID=UPI0033C28BF2
MVGQVRLWEREDHLASLADAARSARAGQGRLVLISGSAGLGKTSVLAQARQIAASAGLRVLTARGTELERDFGFGVARQLFEPWLAGMPAGERAALLSDAGPAAEAVFGPARPGQGAVGDFAVLHGLYGLAARGGSLALLCDDLHWADESSLRFLAYLLPRLDGLGLMVVAAMRPGEAGAATRLLDLITADDGCQVRRLAPLTGTASAELLHELLPDGCEDDFVAACQTAAAGNPLLLRELACTVRTGDLAPTNANAPRVAGLGADAVGRRIALWLDRLPKADAAVAGAVATLGGAPIGMVSRLARLPEAEAADAIADLVTADILRVDGVRVEFVHPLVQAAVYDRLSVTERADRHRCAAGLLATAGAPAEQAAVHLLRIPPGGDRTAIATLRRAADDAQARGAPQAALSYLQRCLAALDENDVRRVEVLTTAGMVAAHVDQSAAVTHLADALELTTDPHDRAEVAYALSLASSLLGRIDEALNVLERAREWVPAEDEELRRRLLASSTLIKSIFTGGDRNAADREFQEIRALTPHDSAGGRMLDCVIATRDGMAGDPAAIQRGLRGLADDVLIHQAVGWPALNGAWGVLLGADLDDPMASLDRALEHGRANGSTFALAAVLTYRGLGRLWRGQLPGAETDLREAVRVIDLAGIDSGRPFAGAFLALTLLERQLPDQAAAALEWVGAPDPVPPVGPWYFYLDALAAVRQAQHRYEESAVLATAAGDNLAVHGFGNPACVPWRTRAAESLHAQSLHAQSLHAQSPHARGRAEQARALAAEELELARRWGAPRALGRALRVLGLLTGGERGHELLRESVEVLRGSPARLEYAHSLHHLGAALRRAGTLTAARVHLTEALDLAVACGAPGLAQTARNELLAAGARPRRGRLLSGPQALTNAEQRVAALAATGLSNRDIAQRLFVIPKTVEVHLTSVYRKLGVSNRAGLSQALEPAPWPL